jgi:two-component system chemotaxis response regulator CheY
MATRILIADDNEAVRGRLGELLATHDGWEVCGSTGSGREAVEKAVELRPSIIILDLAMPEMDGLSAAKEIGKVMPSVPIVIFTLHKFATIDLEAKKAGVRYVVAKPDTETLLRVIDELMKSQPAAESVQKEPDLLAPASGPLDDPASRVTAQAQSSEAQGGANGDLEGTTSTGTN